MDGGVLGRRVSAPLFAAGRSTDYAQCRQDVSRTFETADGVRAADPGLTGNQRSYYDIPGNLG